MENVHFVARICVIELNTELVSISTLATQGFSFLRLTERQYDELLSQQISFRNYFGFLFFLHKNLQ